MIKSITKLLLAATVGIGALQATAFNGSPAKEKLVHDVVELMKHRSVHDLQDPLEIARVMIDMGATALPQAARHIHDEMAPAGYRYGSRGWTYYDEEHPSLRGGDFDRYEVFDPRLDGRSPDAVPREMAADPYRLPYNVRAAVIHGIANRYVHALEEFHRRFVEIESNIDSRPIDVVQGAYEDDRGAGRYGHPAAPRAADYRAHPGDGYGGGYDARAGGGGYGYSGMESAPALSEADQLRRAMIHAESARARFRSMGIHYNPRDNARGGHY